MKRFLSLALLLIGSVIQSAGQVPFFQEYFLLRKNDALQINKILQEEKGYMWFGTSKGLYSFDGNNQERYTAKDGLDHDVVTALAEDSLGRIWIGYENGKLGFIQNSRVELFSPDEGHASKPVSDILFDKRGNLWFSTFNDGLYYFASNRLYRVDEEEGMPDLYIYDLAEDSLGNIWVGTDGGAAICSLNGTKVSIDVIDYDDGLPDNIIKKIIPLDKHTVLMATEDAGIIRYDSKLRLHTPLVEHPWTFGPVNDFLLKDKKIWIGCPQNGVLVYDIQTGREHMHKSNEVEHLGSIRTLALDQQGNIWIGTKSGLSRTAGDGLQFLEPTEPGRSSNILAVTVDRRNNIWYSNPNGLYIKKLDTSEIIKPLSNTPYANYTVISLYTDSKGYIWAGLYGEGVLRINEQTGKIRHLYHEIRNGNILSIAGRANTVWLGTLGGASRITLSDSDKLDVINYSTKDGLISDFIYQVFLENNRVWFATDGKGLGMMNRDGFHSYSDGLPSSVVYGLAQDGFGKLWVNVQGNGLYIFDGLKFRACDSTLVLRDNNIHSLVSDRAGNIVVMHDAGMDIVDIHKNKVVYLGEEMGMRDKIGNLNAAGKDAQGDIYFGSTGGIIKYTSEQGFLINGPRPLLKNISVFDTPIDLSSRSKLSYDENNITLNYVGLWYQNPDGLYYSYKLENYDRDWIVTKNQAVTYSRLPPGNYTFRLKVSESQDFRQARETTLSFSISPPIWQTIPFYVFSIIVLVVSVFFLIRGRERKLKRYNELLETKVQMRTREIQLQNEEIQVQNEEISAQSEEILRINENLEDIVQERTRELERKNKALEEYAFINAHKLRSPVATILGLINLFSKTRLDHEGVEINRRLQDTAEELDGIVSAITKAIERGDKKIPRLKDE